MYVDIYIYIDLYTHIHIHTHTHHIGLHTHTHKHTHTHTHIHTHTYTHTHTHTHMYVDIYIDLYTHPHPPTHTHRPTHTDTHSLSLSLTHKRTGLQWSDLTNDPRCGMGTVMLVLVIEWPIFLLLAAYLDQVLDTGHGLPRHPLFLLGYDYGEKRVSGTRLSVDALTAETDKAAAADREAVGGNMATIMAQDVAREEERVRKMVAGDAPHEAVMVRDIAKTFPAYLGNPPKLAVRTLSMAVPHGECFGMLGPNGAGKTTTINMLVGFTPPSSGTATMEGLDVRTDMDRIYTLMGVCPQVQRDLVHCQKRPIRPHHLPRNVCVCGKVWVCGGVGIGPHSHDTCMSYAEEDTCLLTSGHWSSLS